MRRTFALLTLALAAGLLFAPTALADHVSDGGVDQAWTNAMNQPSYWEERFGGDCTKYENHSGFIPASYEAAVVKDGNMVRVYNPAPNDAVALGAVNPANGQHFAAPHSWVMKCDITTTTTSSTTTTVPETTTSTASVTTTSTVSESTTTSSIPEETTTVPEETTTTPTTVPTTIPEETTVPGELVAEWFASSVCDEITVDFGEGISQVDVWMQGGIPGVDDVTEIQVDSFLAPGTKQTGSNAVFTLVPVVVNGYTAVPDELTLETSRCEEPTTSSSVNPVSTEPDDVLPFTGIDTTLLAVAGAALLGVGVYTVKRGRA